MRFQAKDRATLCCGALFGTMACIALHLCSGPVSGQPQHPDFIIAAVEASLKAVIKEFKIDDSVESKLFAEVMGRKQSDPIHSISITIIRSSQNKPRRQVLRKTFDDRFELRWVRVGVNSIASPLAVVVIVTKQGNQIVTEDVCYRWTGDRWETIDMPAESTEVGNGQKRP